MRDHRTTAALSERINRVLAGSLDAPTIALQRFSPLTKDVAAVVLSAVESPMRWTPEQWQQSVAALTDGKMVLVPDTLIHRTTLASGMVLSALVELQAESVPADEAAFKGKKAVQANLFADPEDNSMWRLVGEEGSKRLLKVGGDDYKAILEAKRSRSPIIASTQNYGTPGVTPRDGDYALFWNHQARKVECGFVLASGDDMAILPNRGAASAIMQPLKIVATQVLEAANITGTINGSAPPADWKQEALASNRYTGAQYVDYMRTLYGGTDYFKALDKAIKQHSFA